MRGLTRRARVSAGALCAGAALLALALPASAVRDEVTLVSQATSGAPGDGSSSEPSVSADGARVAFASSATNLAGGLQGVDDVFVRDLSAGTTTLVSRAGPSGPAADADSGAPAISADGRWVAFASFATNLGAGDSDPTSDIWLRDLQSGAVTLVSRADGLSGPTADLSAFAPSISADGRYVAFHSNATNLSGVDGPGVDVFVRDVVAGTTTLASRADGPAGAGGDGPSTDASISGDGRVVAFTSSATDLTGDALGAAATNVFARDLDAGTTRLVSRAPGAAGAPPDRAAFEPAISADGRHVAFTSSDDGLVPDDRDGTADILVRDLAALTTTLVSRGPGAAGPAGDGTSSAPAVSADGSRVAFVSSAPDLSDADADAHPDVFLRDLATGATILVSRAPGPAGAPADGGSRQPAVTADAVLVAFATEADVIAPEADPGVGDVVIRDVLGTPAPGPPPPPPPPAPAPPPPPAVVAEVVRCAGVPATIVGTPRRDVIRGTPGRDVVAAMGGDDMVRGLGGDDLICLGPGADSAFGGMGSDTLLGGPGADRLNGGTGRDLLKGGRGNDRLAGGAGPDRLVGGPGRDLAIGGPGRDVCGTERRALCDPARPRR